MTELLDRFMSNVVWNGGEDECWTWEAACESRGYGFFHVGSRKAGTHRLTNAHRTAYELFLGPIPEGLTIDHLCRNRGCVNPAHLEAVTIAENIRRGTSPSAENAVKTHCPKGHPYEGDNLKFRPDGRRRCRECSRERSAIQNAKRRRG